MSAGAHELARLQRAFAEALVPRSRGRIRLLATDVDGTLTDPAGRLRPTGLNALHSLRNQQPPPQLVLVTGRPAAAVQGLLIYTGFETSPIIAENGAVVVPYPGAAPHVVRAFKEPHGAGILRYLADAGVEAVPTADTADRWADLTFVPAGEIPPPPEALRRLAEDIEAAVARAPASLHLPACQVVYSSVHVHVGPAGVSKGRTLRAMLTGEVPGLCDTPISDADILCLGDSGNDRSLFDEFPEHAVAVPVPGPAVHEGLRACAHFAAPDVADTGFAAVVSALFPPA